MSRGILVLCILVLSAGPALADRDSYIAAREKLSSADFERMPADERDRLFEALGQYDKPEVIRTYAEVASAFGVYLTGLEYTQGSLQERMRPFADRTALNPQEIAVRNNLTKKIQRAEADWRRGNESVALLVRVLGSYQDPKTVSNAISMLPGHATWRVRQLFADAAPLWHKHLSDATLSKRSFNALKKLTRDKEPRVRVAVARGLVAFKRMEAIQLLEASIKDPDWSVRSAAVKSLAATASSEAVGALIRAMQKEKGRLAGDINNALKELTGRNMEFADMWAKWWEGVGEQLPAKKESGEEGGGTATPTRKFENTDRFYGIETRSDRILYIIDVSGSMNKEVEEIKRGPITGKKDIDTPVGGTTRIEVAKNELKRAIGQLNPKKYFAIIFFNQATKPWRTEMVKATPANKKEAYKAIDVVKASGSTYTLGALREAFSMAGAIRVGGKKKARTKREGPALDTIFLLSDGGPTDNKTDAVKPMDPEIILDNVRGWNNDLNVVIHTVAVHTLEAGTYFLKQLAAQNGGEFRARTK